MDSRNRDVDIHRSMFLEPPLNLRFNPERHLLIHLPISLVLSIPLSDIHQEAGEPELANAANKKGNS